MFLIEGNKEIGKLFKRFSTTAARKSYKLEKDLELKKEFDDLLNEFNDWILNYTSKNIEINIKYEQDLTNRLLDMINLLNKYDKE